MSFSLHSKVGVGGSWFNLFIPPVVLLLQKSVVSIKESNFVSESVFVYHNSNLLSTLLPL